MAELASSEALRPGEARLRIRRVGICGTDLRAYQGRQPYFSYPRILGHELSGEIEQVATDNEFSLQVGDRCAIEPYMNCGHCPACLQGKSNCCARLQVLGVHTDGGMRESIDIPLRKLHSSARLSFDQLALVEMLSIGAHAVRRARPKSGDECLVIGVGPIGLSVLESLRLAGIPSMAMDVNAARLDYCRQSMHVRQVLASGAEADGRLRDACNGKLPQVVFDCTGNSQSMCHAFEYAEHGGKVVFVGLTLGAITFDDPHFHARELSLLASRNATAVDFRQVLLAMEAGRIQPDAWISHRVPYQRVAEEFPRWAEGAEDFRKALVAW